jgi:hypothetical protein
MAEAFARYTGGNAHIILCGRNRAAAETIIASFPKPTLTEDAGPQPVHEFVQCDATLMENVHATTADFLSRLPKVNFLVMSSGFLSLKGRDETAEGIDKRLALYYYARWKYLYDLVPLLQAAKDKAEDAKVMSVLGAGGSWSLDTNNLGLTKNYSVLAATRAASNCNDLMIQVRGFSLSLPIRSDPPPLPSPPGVRRSAPGYSIHTHPPRWGAHQEPPN